MFEFVKKFSVADVQMYREQEEDLDFSIVEIWALAEGTNSHKNPFSREVLESYADTFKGKFIVAKFDKYRRDVRGHELDEAVIGYVSPQDEIEFKTKFIESENKEKEFVVVKALLSKIYAKDVVDMFRTDNNRSVSCEFSCVTQYKENEYGQPIDEYGVVINEENPILKYHIHGITILGKDINPSVKGTEIKIKQFAKQFEEQLNIKELAKERLSLLDKNNNIDKEDTMGEEKNLSMSETDKEEKDIIMEEPKDEEEKVEETAEEKSMEEKEEEPQEEKEMGCGEEGKEMSDDSEQEEDEDDDDDEKQKDFSLGSLVEEGEVTVLLEQFTESNLELAQKLLSMNVKEVLETVISFSEENAELKKFKEERVALDKEIKLSSIMASVKEDLDAKQFEELQKEGESLSYEMLDGFANKVKAFAYENTKQKTQQVAEDDIMRFGGTYTETNESNQDVFDRLSKM